jgi:tryptophan synthase alpha chain
MSRIAHTFARHLAAGRKLLIPYITAGDPDPTATVPMMLKLVEAGADIIELGVPFSDPMADGPVIQRASERALRHHVSLQRVLALVQEFRQHDSTTPVVLMGYLNPIEVMGYDHFASQAANAGVDGVLTVDMPPEEADGLINALQDVAIDPVFLVAPTTTAARVATIGAKASGFVYYVSVKGITGAGHLDTSAVADRVAQLRQTITLPIGVGFGIKDGESARRVAAVADAVVVGSALVALIEKHQYDAVAGRNAVADLMRELRQALEG